jgi:hypothetical protein
VQPRNAWPYDKGVAAGSTTESSRRSGETGRNEGMVQSAIEQMPPRDQDGRIDTLRRHMASR